MKQNKYISFLSISKFAFFAFFLLGTYSVSAAGVVLSPPKFEFTVNGGQVITDKVKITNNDTTPLTLNAEAQDFIASGETGQPAFVKPEENKGSISLARWITINDGQQITINPGEKKEIPFTIRVPEGAEPGGKYGTLFFFPPSSGGQVAVLQKIGSLVLVRVNGTIKEEGKLLDFGIYDKDIKGEDLEKSSSGFFFEKPPVNFSVRFQNTGNIHLKPQGKIELFNMFGSKLEPVGVVAELNDAGIELKKEIVDYIPVNSARGNVLAQSIRKFDTEWEGEPYFYKEEDGTKTIKNKGFYAGLYTAKLTLTGANSEKIERSASFIVFPWKHIGGGIILIVVLYFGIGRYRKWSKKKFEEEIAKRVAQSQK